MPVELDMHPRTFVRRWVADRIREANTAAGVRVFENRSEMLDPFDQSNNCPMIQVWTIMPGKKESVERASTLHRVREFSTGILIIARDLDLESGGIKYFDEQLDEMELQVDRIFKDREYLSQGIQEFELEQVLDPLQDDNQNEDIGAIMMVYRTIYNQSLRDPAEGLPDQDGVDFQFGGSAPQ